MLLTVKNLAVSYGHIRALHGISFEVDKTGRQITISGIDKQVVGQMAAHVRDRVPAHGAAEVVVDAEEAERDDEEDREEVLDDSVVREGADLVEHGG